MIKIFSNYSLMPATLIRRQFENIKCKKRWTPSITINYKEMKLPVQCKMIVPWDDHKIVAALLKYMPIPTEEFFYGKCYPMFKSLHTT